MRLRSQQSASKMDSTDSKYGLVILPLIAEVQPTRVGSPPRRDKQPADQLGTVAQTS
ncbi:hypothetical protein PSPO01_06862 [Paraphaeosphaeria sporulosa]